MSKIRLERLDCGSCSVDNVFNISIMRTSFFSKCVNGRDTHPVVSRESGEPNIWFARQFIFRNNLIERGLSAFPVC